jgi:hypothetical protein
MNSGTACAGLDVHKDTIVACVRCVSPPMHQEVRSFGTTTAELLKLADWLAEHDCTHVAMEATGAVPAVEPASNVTDIETARKKRAPKPRLGLRELPAHLPRRTVVHAATGHAGGCDCQACGRLLCRRRKLADAAPI